MSCVNKLNAYFFTLEGYFFDSPSFAFPVGFLWFSASFLLCNGCFSISVAPPGRHCMNQTQTKPINIDATAKTSQNLEKKTIVQKMLQNVIGMACKNAASSSKMLQKATTNGHSRKPFQNVPSGSLT